MLNIVGESYIALTTIIVIFLLIGYYKVLVTQEDSQSSNIRKMLMLLLPLIIWFVYLIIIDGSGILLNLNMPPKFPLLIFAPFFLYTIIFYVIRRNSTFIQSIPIRWPIIFQSFRVIVEILLVNTYYQEIIPELATFEGANFDILMGLSAPFVALLIYKKTGVNKTLAYLWNILGILMILFVGFIIASSLYFPHIWGETDSTVHNDFLQFPYLLLPAFLAPLAIFMHVVSLIQLRNLRTN